MAKDFLIDYRKLKKISSIAKAYKEGVSGSYIYKLIKQEKIEVIIIDTVHFVNVDSLTPEIKKHLKKI